MIVVCCVCEEVLRVSAGRGVSHGYCQFHGLETLANEGLATPYEHIMHFLLKYNLDPAVMALCAASVAFLGLGFIPR
jgi:hypothetical protein